MFTFKNITVLALEQALVVPYLTYRLAQDGIRVIRLERPDFGDPNRMIGDEVLGEPQMNTYYLCVNAGKKALTLDLSKSQAREILRELIAKLSVDIFVTNQLPKNYDKLGIAYDLLREVKPDIIWLGVTGFGPQSNEPAYDPILQARSGLMEMTGEQGGAPQVLGVPLPDMGSSEHAYGLLMKALFKREVTGEGSRIDLAMFESSLSWQTFPIALQSSFDKQLTRRGNTHEFFAPVSVYSTRDGYVYFAVGNDQQWKRLVSLEPFCHLDLLEYEQNTGRIKDKSNLNRSLNAVCETFSSEELIELLSSIRVPISKIQTIPEVVRDPAVQTGMLSAQDDKTGLRLHMAPPPYQTPYLQESGQTLSFPPRFGEHNREIYSGLLGYSEDKLGDLKAKKVI
ncbi:MAG: CoA transferase [Desulfohalobiaceae bacterium]|nr:CoA transferase [Desulfohalobiaceae bacterium]